MAELDVLPLYITTDSAEAVIWGNMESVRESIK